MNKIALQTFCKKLNKIRQDKRVLFTNGCFDLFHYGHLELLAACKRQADIVIVGVNSDNSIEKIKGRHRPIIPEMQRLKIISAIIYTTYVIVFDEKTPIKLIKAIKPNILLKGGDYKGNEIVGSDYVKSYGGVISTFPLVAGVSTSLIINKIKKYV